MRTNIEIFIGPPGCGKTTHLASMVEAWVRESDTGFGRVPGMPVMVCSLTRAAAAEAAGRVELPRQAVGTLHAHAFRALQAPTLTEGHEPEFGTEHPSWRLSKVGRSSKTPTKANAATTAGVDASDDAGASDGGPTAGSPTEAAVAEPPSRDDLYSDGPAERTRGDQALEQYHLLRARMVPRDRWPAYVVEFATAWEAWKHSADLCDFTDLIESAIQSDVAPVGDPRHLMVDEAQDMSALELALLRKWAVGAESLSVLGDPFQAIFTFRGANPDMFWSEKVPDECRHTLSQSYRVPFAVHRLAMDWVRHLSDYHPIEYHPRDHPGEVTTHPARWQQPEGLVRFIERELDEGRSVMIQATTSYHIAPTVAVLRKHGIPFANPWRTSRGDWNPLTGRGIRMSDRIRSLVGICHNGGDSEVSELKDPSHFSEIQTQKNALIQAPQRLWTGRELARVIQPMTAAGSLHYGAKSSPLLAEDRPLTFEELSSLFTPDALAELWSVTEGAPLDALAAWMNRLPNDRRRAAEYPASVLRMRGLRAMTDRPRVFVGTIHSFKGAEADTVILFPDLSRAAVRQWMAGGTARDECIRAGYVAITRARQRFVLCAAAGSESLPIRRMLHAS